MWRVGFFGKNQYITLINEEWRVEKSKKSINVEAGFFFLWRVEFFKIGKRGPHVYQRDESTLRVNCYQPQFKMTEEKRNTYLRWLAAPYLDFSGTLFLNDFYQVPWAKSSTMEHPGGVWQPFWLIYKQLQELDRGNMKFH